MCVCGRFKDNRLFEYFGSVFVTFLVFVCSENNENLSLLFARIIVLIQALGKYFHIHIQYIRFVATFIYV